MIDSLKILPFLKYKTNYRTEIYPLKAHSHKEISLGYIEKGMTEIKVLNQKYQLVAGDLVLIPADTVHICTPDNPEAYIYHMFYFNREWFNLRFPSLSGGFRTLAVPALKTGKENIQALINSQSDSSIVEVALKNLFTGLIERYRLDQPLSLMQEKMMDKVHERIKAIKDVDYSIDSLAEEVGLNKYSFIRKYARLYGLTPHADIINRRIQRAVLLLDTEIDLATIALECGFSDQSHFSKQFKQFSGLNPGEYRSLYIKRP